MVEDIVGTVAHEHGQGSFLELSWWVGALRHQLAAFRREANALAAASLIPLSQLDAVIGRGNAEINAQWRDLLSLLSPVPILSEIPEVNDRALVQLAALQGQVGQYLSDTDTESESV